MKRLSLIISVILLISFSVSAHPGRTDSRGGHYNRKTGEYHYHNGGGSPTVNSTKSSAKNPVGSSIKSSAVNSAKSLKVDSTKKTGTIIDLEVKLVQQKLNSLGYNCGIADGVMGGKTIKALQDFQKSKGLDVDGKINSATKKALGL